MLSQTVDVIPLAISIIIQIRKFLWKYLNKNIIRLLLQNIIICYNNSQVVASSLGFIRTIAAHFLQ